MKIERRFFDFPEVSKEMQSVVEVEEFIGEIEYPCHLFIDQATKTGFVIADDKRRLVTSGTFTKEDRESLQDYKYGLKKELTNLIEEYGVKMVWHEEAYDKANHQTTEVLYYIKHMIEDLGYELGESIRVLGLDHARWKSLLAKPESFKRDKDDKKQVAKFVGNYYPLLKLTEDETDALGMMIAIIWKSTELEVHYNARINKKLPVHVEVIVLGREDNILEKIEGLGRRFTKKLEGDYGGKIYEFEYNQRNDEVLNCRYFLHFRDAVCWSKIPYHRNIGQILLHYGIIPKHLKEDDEIVVVGSRKK